ACLGSSGKWYALGVFVRTGNQMHVVLTPCDSAQNVDTYFDLINDWQNKKFVYQLIEFVPGTESAPTHWLAGEKPYKFDSSPAQSCPACAVLNHRQKLRRTRDARRHDSDQSAD